ncbi:hypothetical protein ACFOET_17340 [Parapedobacter deserti]|uniref:HEAT repeat domain-containing protein n=1 Tax=Parapedobacter deserti TaxID=1912957 RepID=A0ABV7JN36_9SPHI
MDKQTLVSRLDPKSAKMTSSYIAALAEDKGFPAEVWHDVSYNNGNPSVAFRAARVLEHIATHHPTRFIPILSRFIERLPKQRNLSCQRHFTKILMLISSTKAPSIYKDAYAGVDSELVIETVFSWLIDPRTPVAVQVNCMDVLLNICSETTWIAEELQRQIEFLMRDGSAAVQSRGKKALAKLHKIRNAG